MTVTFKGEYYKGKLTKTFTIHPKKTSISTITTPASNVFTVSWKKPGNTRKVTFTDGTKDNVYYPVGLTGYQIQYSTNKNFKNAKSIWVKGEYTTTQNIVIKDYTTMKKKYYVRIRAYMAKKVNGKQKKFYSAWSAKKGVTTEGIVWKGSCPLYTILFDENGWPYFYGLFVDQPSEGGYGVKGEACREIMREYALGDSQIPTGQISDKAYELGDLCREVYKVWTADLTDFFK